MKRIIISSKSKYMIVINLFLIFILMTVSVYAWFASNVNNNVNISEIEVQADNNLQLSLDGKTWSGSLNLDSIVKTMKFVEVTGNGEKFYIPKLEQYPNYALVDLESDFTALDDNAVNVSYLKFDVYMRSEDALNVHLSSESYAAPLCGDKDMGDDCLNPANVKLADGAVNFSKDCIVGALRVSYKDASGARKVWITNPEYHLNNTIGTDIYSMTKNGTGYIEGDNTEENGKFKWDIPTKHYYYNADKEIITNDNALTSIESFTDDTKLATLAKNANVLPSDVTPEANYNYGKATFTVWLEGCDTEARQALLGGKFSLSLALDSYTDNPTG